MKKLTKVILVSSLAQEGRGNRWRRMDRSLRSFLNFRKVLKLKAAVI